MYKIQKEIDYLGNKQYNKIKTYISYKMKSKEKNANN